MRIQTFSILLQSNRTQPSGNKSNAKIKRSNLVVPFLDLQGTEVVKFFFVVDPAVFEHGTKRQLVFVGHVEFLRGHNNNVS